MNIIEKLANARVELANMKLKKTGFNSYANFEYYELSDILPAIREIELKYNMVSTIEMTGTTCVLLINSLNEENVEYRSPSIDRLQFSVPFVLSDMKGVQSTQCLGASITYIKRYLYTLAYAIEEEDELDKTVGQDFSKPQKQEEPKEEHKYVKMITEGQINAIRSHGLDEAAICKYYKVNKLEELTSPMASEVIRKNV